MSKQKQLNKAEIQMLKLLMNGMYIKNTAKQLKLSEYQAYKISKSIQTKLNAKNMPNAVFIAYTNNLIK